MWMHPEIYSDSEVYRLFQATVRFVATDENLESSWLSTNVGDFLHVSGPLPKVKLWKKFGPVLYTCLHRQYLRITIVARGG